MVNQNWLRWVIALLLFSGVLLAVLWLLRGDQDAAPLVALGLYWIAWATIPNLVPLPSLWGRFSRYALPFSRLGAVIAGIIFISGGLLWHALRNWLLVVLIMMPVAGGLMVLEQHYEERQRARRRRSGGRPASLS